MPRFALRLSYDGTAYSGWQIQPNGNTIQGEMEKALGTIIRKEVPVTGCGRTDAGVHALDYYAHIDLDELPEDNLLKKINGILPHDIGVREIIPVNDEWHARFDAVRRSYIYKVHLFKDPFAINRSLRLFQKPDFELMNKCAQMLLGKRDFESFSKVHTEVNHFECDVKEAQWNYDSDEWAFHITADRFLRNMVRAIVGTLLDVGYGKTRVFYRGKRVLELDMDFYTGGPVYDSCQRPFTIAKKTNEKEFENILSSKRRTEAGYSVPAHGLYLSKVKYEKFE